MSRISYQTFDPIPGSLPSSKQDKHRTTFDPKIAYNEYIVRSNNQFSDLRRMMNGKSKEQCARCKALGIFICEHKTPIRDKFRKMYADEGKFYESPRDYEEQLEPTIFSDQATYGSQPINQSHNALSFQRLLVIQKKHEEEHQLAKSLNESSLNRKQKRVLKISSLRHNNVNISRLSFKQTPRRTVSVNNNYNTNRKPINLNDKDELAFKKSKSSNKNHSNSKNDNEDNNLEDLDEHENENNVNNTTQQNNLNNNNANNVKKDQDVKKDKKGFCTIL